MACEFNGLKALVLKDNSSAYYIHCFAHQLQLVVVPLANKHDDIWAFFDKVSTLKNVVCSSYKRIDMIRESQKEKLKEAIGHEEVETGSGLNQEISLARAGDTRWSSHHKTLVRLVQLYPSIIEVLAYIQKSTRFGVTNLLSQALQRKDQDIVNAIQIVNATKQQLQTFRLERVAPLLKDVASFCEKNEIEIINMEDEYIEPKYKRKKTCITNRYHYEVENFNTILDMQIQELGNRFNEVGMLYPRDFSYEERENLMIELDNYVINLKGDEMFANMNGVSNLAQKMVETKKHLGYPLVSRLLKLTLVLPVATEDSCQRYGQRGNGSLSKHEKS
ncbi:uncharacterized protein LOC143532532 [Bidens hawaiensis]|uniref:uncharacterized protein LOC143532532 n=1 Tax=Bidens hawaiensis TaxID=980011 RepID=UPI00404991AC